MAWLLRSYKRERRRLLISSRLPSSGVARDGWWRWVPGDVRQSTICGLEQFRECVWRRGKVHVHIQLPNWTNNSYSHFNIVKDRIVGGAEQTSWKNLTVRIWWQVWWIIFVTSNNSSWSDIVLILILIIVFLGEIVWAKHSMNNGQVTT